MTTNFSTADVCVAVDYPNTMMGLREASATHRDADRGPVRFEFPHWWRLLHADRPVRSALICASDRPALEKHWPRMQQLGPGVELVLREPGRITNTEQGVDETLLARCARLLDEPPGVLVLVTGDGAGHQHGDGFLSAARRLAGHGWGIEIVAWKSRINRHLARWANETPGAELIYLDDYYEQITFCPASRRHSARLDLTGRPTASVTAVPAPLRRWTESAWATDDGLRPSWGRMAVLELLENLEHEGLVRRAKPDAFGQAQWLVTPAATRDLQDRFRDAA